ncbi:MAG: CoA pyrophosphatase [Candidatus Nitrosocaldus sp.]
MQIDIDRIALTRRVLKSRLGYASINDNTARYDDSKRIPAAVLLIIHYTDGYAKILLCKRSGRLRNHAGQISLPGGTFKPEDDGSLLDTALREAREEIGVDLSKDSILGSLEEVDTFSSNFTVKPFVAVLDSISSIKIDEKEVDYIIDAPLVGLLSNMSRDEEHGYREAYKFTYKGHIIWGATARILKQLRDILEDAIPLH